jgi:Signal transduction histidine kinase, nitrogen specific
MSFLRTSKNLPLHTALQFSPWLLVGFAVILGLAISFWAVKNAQLERENMSRVLLERSGALMWAMEGGARAGMAMQSSSYMQQMLEETARQKDIKYIAIVNRSGQILLHSDRQRIGGVLSAPDSIDEQESSSTIHWRVVKNKGESGSTFQAFKPFVFMPGFGEHTRHGRGHKGMMHKAGRDAFFWGMGNEHSPPVRQEEERRQDKDSTVAVRPGQAPQAGDFFIAVALDMTPFEKALSAGRSSILFNAFLVGMLGVGGFISLFWAQSYKLSRRLLLDASAVADKVISSLPMGLMILDASGQVVEANSVAGTLLGYGGKGLIGLDRKDIQGLDWRAIAARVESGETVLEEEHTLMLPSADGQEDVMPVAVGVSAAKVLNDEGESLGLVFLLRDLREVKRLQKELRRSERLSTLGNMAARVAHEIRNPLSSIKGFATYLGSRRTDEDGTEAARTMIGEVDRLNRVVSELLDFARPSNLTIVPRDIVAILLRALRLMETDAASRRVVMQLDRSGIPDSCHMLVAVDEERVTQALLNLFINAVQAADEGGTVTVYPFPARGNRLGIRVKDTGCGMPEAVRAQIFNPYFTTKAAGTGLGLAIVSKIIEDHNGEIDVQSTEGVGTEITVYLPIAEPAGQETPSCSESLLA